MNSSAITDLFTRCAGQFVGDKIPGLTPRGYNPAHEGGDQRRALRYRRDSLLASLYILALIAALLAAGPLLAQNAELSGLISDPSGPRRARRKGALKVQRQHRRDSYRLLQRAGRV